MKTLDLVYINGNAPYQVGMGYSQSSYIFTTDFGVDYSIDFIADDLIENDDSYQLIIANLNQRKSPRDIKVRDTVLAVIEQFFTQNQATLLYICQTGDSKQKMRNRLFEYWFSSYSYRYLYTLLSSSVVDEEGVVNYATLIIRNDNPRLHQVINEFTESVSMLSQKPDI